MNSGQALRRVPGFENAPTGFSPLKLREWFLTLPGVTSLEPGSAQRPIPGISAEILDDEVRWVLTKGKLPTSAWVDVVTTAHEVGIRSSSTMMYGHVEQPRHWVGHLNVLREIQDRTGGFTEFVPLPFVHQSSPLYLAGGSRPGPTHRDNRAVHALARIMLHGRISNIQTSWVKLGVERTQVMLTGGANDTTSLSMLVSREAIDRVEIGMGSALAVILFLCVLIIAAIFVKGFKVDLAAGRNN